MTARTAADGQTLHMIGHSHIDPVWLWQWPEGFQEIKATFRSALDRLAEFDDFVYTASSAAFYDWVERSDPAMFSEIRQRVAEGRWQVVGGWWVEPDCNLPCGESFVRQALIGQRYFTEKLGVAASVGFNPDSFGHHGMLPQILAKSGLSAYVFMRPGPHEQGLPGRVFWWESDDGSRVLAFRIAYEYGSWGKAVDTHVRRCADEMKPPVDHFMCFYGVGDHGGGPTVENLTSIRRLQQAPDPPELVFSHPERFFAAVRESGVDLPVVHSELQHHASGCYATHSGIKRWNRRAENLLLGAERLCAVAGRVTAHRSGEDLTRAWKNVLFNQFHDLLPGTSIEPAYEDARDELGEASAVASRAVQAALQSLTWRIGIPPEEGTTPIVVWNPHSWPSRQCVELELARLGDSDALVDDAGGEVAVQAVQSLATVAGPRRRAAFVADLPPLGYRLYRVRPALPRQDVAPVAGTDHTLESERLRLRFNPDTGYLESLFDKRAEVEVLRGDGARPEVLDDPSDTWGHGMLRFDDLVGAFSATRVGLVQQGPVKSVVRVDSAYGSSRMAQEFILYRDLEYVDVRVVIDWREQRKALKLRFPTNLHSPKATYEIPFGHVERPADGEEEPGQRWVDLTGLSRDNGEVYGLSVANDGKHSFDLRGAELSLTVLRSPIYAHHAPHQPDPAGRYSFQDQGPQSFCYRLIPHAAGWERAGTVRLAAALNQPPTALVESCHDGPLPAAESYLQIDAPNVVMSALKPAEDGGAVILRCYETDRVATRARMRLPRWNREFGAAFAPCEIKTFRIPDAEDEPVTETNLLEWPE
ncbi:MAG: alpha-mannosidase [Euzebyales bacterium]|nr:alpha-mannosidase [Euzebyales bacterium]MBA3621355.1 alpha-mannosidase [Euzebyales bacterium]